jgi:RES domain
VVKLPLPPRPGELEFQREHLRVAPTTTVLWRVHRTIGEHVVPWNQLRYWGPASAMRFDPHEPPAHVQDRGVTYAAVSVPTALAEVFQQTRVINTRRDAPYLTSWSPVRPLVLLDLAGTWPIKAGASHAINTGRRDHCRAWARTIHVARPDLDGLWHQSSMTGGEAVTLFTHAADSFPERPLLSKPLDHPGLRGRLLVAATEIGYRVV